MKNLKDLKSKFKTQSAKAAKGILESTIVVAINVKGKDNAGHEIDDWVKKTFPGKLLSKPANSKGVKIGEKFEKFDNFFYEQMFAQRFLKHPDPKNEINAKWFVVLNDPIEYAKAKAEADAKKETK